MKEIDIYLIRHGKTYCNKERLYYGKSDVPLSDEGINELILKKEKNKYPMCEKYFTSGLKRANQTLEILYPDKEYDILSELCEYDFGEFELKSHEDLKDHPKYNEWVIDETGSVSCPNGESRQEFKSRIQIGFNKLIESLKINNIDSAVAVIHGGTIGMLLEILYDNKKSFIEWQPNVGEGYKVVISTEFPIKILNVTKIF
ncbi:histidine phosphatase family protein [Clostridium weizhouense]|uniref:Histidine phosphatase family protein n=1 Tax=Clostridium weizhouense TaxID=2859781 RepID=A0ABS7ALD1_9CLOT|nr:phosphoglycerate mutase family protein [Clostridium weizhouense]MBW6409211.1 histidine phosphatase family protein [Clostridium weizhouense]